MKMRTAVLVATLFATSCAQYKDQWGNGYVYKEYGAFSQEKHRDKDFAECTAETLKATTDDTIRRFQQSAFMVQCMSDRGWRSLGTNVP